MTAAEQDAFEEKLFDDDELFYEVSDVENRLVDQYVAGGLDDAELARFERSFGSVPGRANKVANARVLGTFIEENRPVAPVAESQRSWLERLGGLFAVTPAFGMAGAAAVLLLAFAVTLLVVRDRRREAEMAQLRGEQERVTRLQGELDASRQREQELQSAVNNEREASGDFVDELDRERQRREQIERELEQIKQKPVEAPDAPIIASVLLLPIGTRGGQGGTVPTVKIGANTKRIALRLTLPDTIETDERLSVSLNKKRVATGIKPRVSAGKKTLNVTVPAANLIPGRNGIEVHDEEGREVGSYGIQMEHLNSSERR